MNKFHGTQKGMHKPSLPSRLSGPINTDHVWHGDIYIVTPPHFLAHVSKWFQKGTVHAPLDLLLSESSHSGKLYIMGDVTRNFNVASLDLISCSDFGSFYILFSLGNINPDSLMPRDG